jgi:hypothetical protein
VPPPRFPGLEHRRARLEPWARIEGALGGRCAWESGHLTRCHNSSARVRLVDGGLWWPEGGATAVELERDIKRLDRYQPAVADVDAAWPAGVVVHPNSAG